MVILVAMSTNGDRYQYAECADSVTNWYWDIVKDMFEENDFPLTITRFDE